MNFHINYKNVLISILLTILSETVIVYYAFNEVPKSADLYLPGFVLELLSGDHPPMPGELYYLIPVLAFLLIVIWPLGCSRISIWLIGIVVLYIEILVYLDVNVVTGNAFGFWSHGAMGGVGVYIVPFWCIFFFLWELLFCIIAKLWRKKHRRNQPKTDH